MRIVETAIVKKVIDGDTVKVLLAGQTARQSVRLVGIDSPELRPAQCWGQQATRILKTKLPVGAVVTLTSDLTQDVTDRYGRLLRYLTYKGTDINGWQVRRGNARVYVYAGVPFERTTTYRARQKTAKAKTLGLWGC